MMQIPQLKPSDIEVKVKQVKENGAVALLYKTARVDMAILDTVFGAMNWQCDYREIKGNLYCGIGVRQSPDDDFVWKWDCGIESREDEEGNQKKGEASDSFKRAGFKWGIGRELYTAPFIWLAVETEKKGDGYRLYDRFAKFTVKKIDYDDFGQISNLTIINQKGNVVFTYGALEREKAQHENWQPPQVEKPSKSKYNQILDIVDGTSISISQAIEWSTKKFGVSRLNDLTDSEFDELVEAISNAK